MKRADSFWDEDGKDAGREEYRRTEERERTGDARLEGTTRKSGRLAEWTFINKTRYARCTAASLSSSSSSSSLSLFRQDLRPFFRYKKNKREKRAPSIFLMRYLGCDAIYKTTSVLQSAAYSANIGSDKRRIAFAMRGMGKILVA